MVKKGSKASKRRGSIKGKKKGGMKRRKRVSKSSYSPIMRPMVSAPMVRRRGESNMGMIIAVVLIIAVIVIIMAVVGRGSGTGTPMATTGAAKGPFADYIYDNNGGPDGGIKAGGIVLIVLLLVALLVGGGFLGKNKYRSVMDARAEAGFFKKYPEMEGEMEERAKALEDFAGRRQSSPGTMTKEEEEAALKGYRVV